jgi:hypothetical protein
MKYQMLKDDQSPHEYCQKKKKILTKKNEIINPRKCF